MERPEAQSYRHSPGVLIESHDEKVTSDDSGFMSHPDSSAEPGTDMSKAACSTFHLVSYRSLTLDTSHTELLTCALKPAPRQVFSISENRSSIPPIAQAKNLRTSRNFLSFFYTPHSIGQQIRPARLVELS